MTAALYGVRMSEQGEPTPTLTVADVAAELDLSRAAAVSLLNRGTLWGVKVPGRHRSGEWRTTRAALSAYKRQRDPSWLTVSEVAAELGVTRRAVRDRIDDGHLVAEKDSAGNWRVTRGELARHRAAPAERPVADPMFAEGEQLEWRIEDAKAQAKKLVEDALDARNRAILRWRDARPDASVATIGKAFHLSRERTSDLITETRARLAAEETAQHDK
jgi:excisionase family DNA binding protein